MRQYSAHIMVSERVRGVKRPFSFVSGRSRGAEKGLRTMRRRKESILGYTMMACQHVSSPRCTTSCRGIYDWVLAELAHRDVNSVEWKPVSAISNTLRKSCQKRQELPNRRRVPVSKKVRKGLNGDGQSQDVQPPSSPNPGPE